MSTGLQGFRCQREGLTIRGTVFLPEGRPGERFPAAILCHEFMANQLFSYPYAKTLAQCGYAAFCFDFCGGGLISASEGSSRKMSVRTEMADLKAVMQFACKQDYTDGKPPLLVGCSQGGLVAALAAAEQPQNVRGLILLYLAKKRAEGKHCNVAISHASKKLVRLIYAMEKSQQPYRPAA